jgi:menaquinone-dependent protoporphyrinogen oxidase
MNNTAHMLLIALFLAITPGCGNSKDSQIEASFGKGENMPKKILVAYGSFSGSTAETAVFIGKKLSEKAMEADVKPVEKIRSIAGYDAVILGSAVMMGKIKPSVLKFAEKNREALARVPVAVFLVCLTMKDDTPENRKTASSYLDPIKAIIKPFSEGLFPGRVTYNKIPFPVRLLTYLPAFRKGVPEVDYLNWPKVEKWVDEIASKI